MSYLKNKTAGFYLSWIAAILVLGSVVSYQQAGRKENYISVLMVVILVLQAACSILMGWIKDCKWTNLILTVNAVLTAVALANSFFTQVDALGYVVSGLYGFETIRAFVTAAVCMAAALILYIISSYIGFEKNKDL